MGMLGSMIVGRSVTVLKDFPPPEFLENKKKRIFSPNGLVCCHFATNWLKMLFATKLKKFLLIRPY